MYLIVGIAVYSCTDLSWYMFLVTQARGVGIFSANTVHGVVYLWSGPTVDLERCSYPLEGVTLDPAAEKLDGRNKHVILLFMSNSLYTTNI